MAIDAVHVGNFKAFGKTQRLPIKPLTLIFGPNSSGKSSLIQALQLLKGIADTHEFSADDVRIGDQRVPLPEFEHFVHRQDLNSSVTFGLEGEASISFPGHERPLKRKISLGFSFGLIEPLNSEGNWSARLNLAALVLKVEDVLSIRFVHEYFFEQFNDVRTPTEGDGYLLTKAELDSSRSAEGLLQCFYELSRPGSIFVASPSNPSLITLENKLQVGQFEYFSIYAPDPEEAGVLRARYESELLLIDQALKAAAKLLSEVEELRCLPALRSFPKRGQRLRYFSTDVENEYRADFSPWEKVANDPDLFRRLNDWVGPNGASGLKTPYELVVVPDLNAADIRESLLQSQDRRLKDLRFTSDEPFRPARLLLHDLRTGALVGHEDVGSGLGQIIPVLVETMGAGHRTIQTISQPELHLHPKLQADLMDFFILEASRKESLPSLFLLTSFDAEAFAQLQLRALELQATKFQGSPPWSDEERAKRLAELVTSETARWEALNTLWRLGELGYDGARFILETHSEAMILRLMRRMRETAEGRQPPGFPGIKPEHVAILYVEPHEHGSVVHELELADDGTLLDPWPGGFFSDGFEDRFA